MAEHLCGHGDYSIVSDSLLLTTPFVWAYVMLFMDSLATESLDIEELGVEINIFSVCKGKYSIFNVQFQSQRELWINFSFSALGQKSQRDGYRDAAAVHRERLKATTAL